MQAPIHSRGTGRSGPKRKTGCLTCRRRKVRCDEARPVCANCIRLRLDCEYVDPKPRSPARPQALEPKSQAPTQAFVGSQPLHVPTTHAYQLPTGVVNPYTVDEHEWDLASELSSTLSAPLPHNYFPGFADFDADLGLVEAVGPEYNFGGPQRGEMGAASAELTATAAAFASEQANPVGWQQNLIDYFVDSINPTLLILPTDNEWRCACPIILAMARQSPAVLSSILGLSKLHLAYTTADDSSAEWLAYYHSASQVTESIFGSADVDTEQLAHAFASTFLLACIELTAATTTLSNRLTWPLRHLRSFQHRLRSNYDHVRSWLGPKKQVILWTGMLQVKAQWITDDSSIHQVPASSSQSLRDESSFDPNLVHALGSQSRRPRTGDPVTSDLSTGPQRDHNEASQSASDWAYDALNQPGLEFFLRAQAFVTPIIRLKSTQFHHERSQSEQNTIHEGQRILAELRNLWTTSSQVTNLLNNLKQLDQSLQPRLAQRIVLNTRVYVAHFYAQVINLHRSAFPNSPASHDVHTATRRIIELTRDILLDLVQHIGSQTTSPSDISTPGCADSITESLQMGRNLDSPSQTLGLSPTMMWPLFLAATECGAQDRSWIVQVLHGIDKWQCPSAARTIPLLEGVLRRQDEEGSRVDHADVMKELFGGELAVFF